MKQVLTDEQITALLQPAEYSIGGHGIERHQSRREFARAIEQAVLESDEVKRAMEDAERWREWLSGKAILCQGNYPNGKSWQSFLAPTTDLPGWPESFAAAIDAARGKK